MHVIVVANQKGGAGKTTLCRNLAVAAGDDVALIDRDPQGSLTSWWNRREAETPTLVPVTGPLADTIEALREAGAKMVFIDTPPAANANLAGIIAIANFVLIPVRPTPDDLDAVGPTLDLIAAARKPFGFVLSQAKARTRLAIEAVPNSLSTVVWHLSSSMIGLIIPRPPYQDEVLPRWGTTKQLSKSNNCLPTY